MEPPAGGGPRGEGGAPPQGDARIGPSAGGGGAGAAFLCITLREARGLLAKDAETGSSDP